MDAKPTTFLYKTAGDCPIYADVYRPDNPSGAAILWLHGGMLMAGGRDDLPAYQRQRYTAAGYTVVSADYRLAPETKLESIIEDVQGVYAWLRDFGARELGLDPARIAVI